MCVWSQCERALERPDLDTRTAKVAVRQLVANGPQVQAVANVVEICRVLMGEAGECDGEFARRVQGVNPDGIDASTMPPEVIQSARLRSGMKIHNAVADEAGGSQAWSPLGAPSGLPCFVTHLHGLQFKSLVPQTADPGPQTVTVRMETPVLYFYAPRKTTVSVDVDFPRGLITEWYPRASKVSPGPQVGLPPVGRGHIEWSPLTITPGEKPALPHGAGASHYYAARNTDSDPVRIGQDNEKFLFYRGIANFEVPLSARVIGANSVELRTASDEPMALAVLDRKS